MSEWIAGNITWILGTGLVYIVLFTAYLVRMDMKIKYLSKRDSEMRDEFKTIIEKLEKIETNIAVILDRQDRGEK